MSRSIWSLAKKIIFKIQRVWAIALIWPTIKAYRSIDGFLSTYEAVTLYRLASELPANSTIVEIGSWKGKSTYCLALGLRDGKVIAIDPFDSSGEPGSAEIYQAQHGNGTLFTQFRTRMEDLGVWDKIEVREGYSHQFVGQTLQIDLLFIDGDHSCEGCDYDFTNYASYLAKGGILAFHDVDPNREELGPTWVVNNRVIPSESFTFIGLFDSLWVGRRK